jgi:hypothetical protein
MDLLVLLVCLELFGFAGHSRGDPPITKRLLYQLSYNDQANRYVAEMMRKPKTAPKGGSLLSCNLEEISAPAVGIEPTTN